jgi:hypothetical protein
LLGSEAHALQGELSDERRGSDGDGTGCRMVEQGLVAGDEDCARVRRNQRPDVGISRVWRRLIRRLRIADHRIGSDGLQNDIDVPIGEERASLGMTGGTRGF